MIKRHPSNRAERLQLKKIKEFGKESKSGRVRRSRLEYPEERLDHELVEVPLRKGSEEPMA